MNFTCVEQFRDFLPSVAREHHFPSDSQASVRSSVHDRRGARLLRGPTLQWAQHLNPVAMDRSRATDRDEVERFLATLAYVKVYGLFRSWFVLVLV